jgi:hypothetical protein
MAGVPVPAIVKKRMKNAYGQDVSEMAAEKRGGGRPMLPRPKRSFLPVTKLGPATKFAPSGPLRERKPTKKNGFDMNKIQKAAQRRVAKSSNPSKRYARKAGFKVK